MPIEKHPTTPLAHNFRPPGGTPYRVQNGDTWMSLAAKVHIDVWNLIDYNFHTRNPDEVNWYLRRNVGCRKATPDGKNYIFSSDANPGFVYLPQPFGAPVNYAVPGVFDIIAQPLNMACWATTATMMLSWRDRQSYPINTALAMCGAKWVGVFNEKMLRAHGPLAIVTAYPALPSIHVRIMVGISGDGSAGGTTVDLIDPAGGTRYRQNFGAFSQSFEAIAGPATASSATTASSAQIWHF